MHDNNNNNVGHSPSENDCSIESQPHNNTTHNNKFIDQQWPFLGQIYVFFSTLFDVTRFNTTITSYV